MEHVISIEEFHSRKVERKEAGETSRGHYETVIVASATEKLNITVQEKGSNRADSDEFYIVHLLLNIKKIYKSKK